MKKIITFALLFLCLTATPALSQRSHNVILPSEKELQRAVESGISESEASFKFGQPRSINKSYGYGKENIQWAYDGFNLYFLNGKMNYYQIRFK